MRMRIQSLLVYLLPPLRLVVKMKDEVINDAKAWGRAVGTHDDIVGTGRRRLVLHWFSFSGAFTIANLELALPTPPTTSCCQERTRAVASKASKSRTGSAARLIA